jgi:hypothetical protein
MTNFSKSLDQQRKALASVQKSITDIKAKQEKASSKEEILDLKI